MIGGLMVSTVEGYVTLDLYRPEGRIAGLLVLPEEAIRLGKLLMEVGHRQLTEAAAGPPN